MHEIAQILHVLHPQAGVDIEAQLRLDRLDAIGVADAGQLSPCDCAGNGIAGDDTGKQEADSDRDPRCDEVDTQAAKQGSHRYPATVRRLVFGDATAGGQPQLSRSISRTGMTTFGSLPVPLIIA